MSLYTLILDIFSIFDSHAEYAYTVFAYLRLDELHSSAPRG
jgi:hypothetical protein